MTKNIWDQYRSQGENQNPLAIEILFLNVDSLQSTPFRFDWKLSLLYKKKNIFWMFPSAILYSTDESINTLQIEKTLIICLYADNRRFWVLFWNLISKVNLYHLRETV